MQRRASSYVGRDDGLRRADVEAGLAGAAVAGFGRVHRQGQVGVDLAEEEPRAVLAVQQQRVLAAPAEPGFGGEFDFQHRRAVGEDAVMVFADFRADLVGQALQAVAQDFMVVAPQRVAGKVGGVGIIQHRMRVGRGGRKVIDPCADDADRAGHQFGGPAALGAVRRHIIHLAMKASIQPFLQARFGRAQLAVGNAHRGKTELLPPLLDLLRQST